MYPRRSIRRFLFLVLPMLVLACGGDTAGPDRAELAEVFPAEGATGVAAAPRITVSYTGSITLPAEGAVITLLGGSTPITGTASVTGGRTITFVPGDILDPDTRYTVELASAVRDAQGAALPGKTWQFTTMPYAPALGPGENVWHHIGVLAHDSMGGRRGGTADEVRAANYIRARFQEYGLAGVAFQSFTYSGGNSQNVLGTLPGTGALKDEWVVIGGHYDHVGRSATGAVYNGADDNASGTAMVLELARTLSEHAQRGRFGTQDRRSVLFMAFGAEEAGLIGSNWFCGHPTAPLASMAGMINLDMIGRLRGGTLAAYGVESSPEWIGLVQRYRGPLLVTPGSGLVGTDYRCFIQNLTPGLALFTGTHADYHKTTDDLELINLDGEMQVGTLALGLATNLMLRPALLRRQ